MTAMIVGMTICLALSLVIMALVALPARRQGREILTVRGERVLVKVRQGADSASARGSGMIPKPASDKRKAS